MLRIIYKYKYGEMPLPTEFLMGKKQGLDFVIGKPLGKDGFKRLNLTDVRTVESEQREYKERRREIHKELTEKQIKEYAELGLTREEMREIQARKVRNQRLDEEYSGYKSLGLTPEEINELDEYSKKQSQRSQRRKSEEEKLYELEEGAEQPISTTREKLMKAASEAGIGRSPVDSDYSYTKKYLLTKSKADLQELWKTTTKNPNPGRRGEDILATQILESIYPSS
jgi:hypothetical protein